MTVQAPLDATRQINKSAKAVSELGFEIVDIDGFLGLVETHAVQQHEALQALSSNVDKMTYANRDATVLAQGLRATSAKARQDIANSVTLVRTFSDKTRDVASWVTSVRDRSITVGDTLKPVQANNAQIANIEHACHQRQD